MSGHRVTIKWLAILLALLLVVAGCAGASTTTGSPSGAPTPAPAAPSSATSAPAAPAAKAPQGAPVKIGVLLPLTGPLAALGTDVSRGFELAKDLVNAQGGVWGSQVELAVADAPGSEEATSQANRLITNEGVKVIAGSYSSGISFAASQVAERNKVIYWEQGAVADDITSRGFKYLFRLIYPASELGRGAARFTTEVVLPKLNIPLSQAKVAIMNEDSSYGTATAKGQIEWLKEKGVQVVDHSPYSYKTNDLSSIVQKHKSLQPDIVIATSYVPDAILYWRQAREANLQVKALVGNGGGHNMVDFAKALGDDVNGVFNAGTSVYFDPKGLQPEAQELFKTFHDSYVKKYGVKPSPHSGMGFNGMWLLLTKVLPAAGEMDVEKIRQAAFALDMPVGSTIVGWGVKFDEKTQNNTRSFPMIDQWQTQQYLTIYPFEFGVTDKITAPMPDWGQRQNVGQ